MPKKCPASRYPHAVCPVHPICLLVAVLALSLTLSVMLQGDGKAVPDSQPEEGPFWSLMFEVSNCSLFTCVHTSKAKFTIAPVCLLGLFSHIVLGSYECRHLS